MVHYFPMSADIVRRTLADFGGSITTITIYKHHHRCYYHYPPGTHWALAAGGAPSPLAYACCCASAPGLSKMMREEITGLKDTISRQTIEFEKTKLTSEATRLYQETYKEVKEKNELLMD